MGASEWQGDADPATAARLGGPGLFEEVQDLVQVGTWEWEVATGRLWWSHQTDRILGAAVGAVAPTYERFIEAVHPEDRRVLWHRITEALEGRQEFDLRHRVVRPDGEVRYVRGQARVRRSAAGTPVTMLGTLLDVTDDALLHAERDEAVARLAESEEKYRLLAENAYDVIWTMGVDGAITYVSPSVERVRGITPAEAMAQTLDQIHPPSTAARVAEYFGQLYASMAAGTVPPTYHGEHEYYRKDGSLMLGDLQVTPQVNSDGQVVQILGVTRDITAQRQFEEALARSEQQFRLAMVSAPIGMAVVDLDRRFVRVNPALCLMLGRSERWLLDRGIADLFQANPEADERDRQVRRQLLAGIDSATNDERMVTAAGEDLIVTHAIGLLRDEHGTPLWYVSQFVDNTETRRAQDQLEFLATHDAMTSLANRAHLLDVLATVLVGFQQGGGRPGVLFIDLDNLKGINDTHGHAVGDQVIVALAEQLRISTRPGDLAARIGGDEFVVVLHDLPDVRTAAEMAEVIQRELSAGLATDGGLIVPTVSIGLALAESADDAEALLTRADQALYRAKQAGRDRIAVDDATRDGG